MGVRHITVGSLQVEIYRSSEEMGAAAAKATADILRQMKTLEGNLAVIFATGASQLSTLDALTSIPELPWDRISGFHLDEYVGLPPDHPASFRRYLREHLTQLVPLREFHEIDGTTSEPGRMCREYIAKLNSSAPQLCLLGVGENGHIAFNDPGEADFNDPEGIKVVDLDAVCRQQQFAEGWFGAIEQVPRQAFTLTIPTVLRVPNLIVSIPGSRKAHVVRRMLEEPISTACPATILRNHTGATVYLDHGSAAELDGLLMSQSE